MKGFITILLLISSLLLRAGTESFDAGNSAYREGNYELAIEHYEKSLETGQQPKVLYNLANAYYKTGDYTRAILHYERALKFLPNDDDVKHNLEIARLNIVDKIEATPEFFLITWWKSLASRLKADTWTILFLTGLWFSIACFLIFAFTGTGLKKVLFTAGLFGIFLSVILLLLALTQHHYETDRDSAILMAPSASVKSAPLNSGTDLFIIHEGLKVQVIDSEPGWYKICLPDGKQGWLPEDAAERI